MGDNHVLKITTDADEAKNSHKIIGQNANHVVRVFDVFRFKNVGLNFVPFYGLVLEKLHPLSKEEEDEFRGLAKVLLEDDVIQSLGTHDWNKVRESIEEFVTERVYNDFGLTVPKQSTKSAPAPSMNSRPATPPQGPRALFRSPAPPGEHKKEDAQARVEHNVAALDELARKYQVPEILKDLGRLGITFYDLHEGNLMKRGGSYVVTDLGRSDSGGAEPPVLERIISSVLDSLLEAGPSGANAANFTQPGGQSSSTKGGSSAWSSGAGNMTPEDEEEGNDRYNKFSRRLQPITHGHPDERSLDDNDDDLHDRAPRV
jgi:hypothetical protein